MSSALHAFTVAEYHRMIRLGILKEDAAVELLEGYVVKKMAQNPPHDAAVTRLQRRLARLPSDECVLRIQCAVTTRDSEPEPDVVVASGPEEKYDTRRPGPADIVLLVEVAESSLEEDRETKGPLYARAKIPLYWIVNLQQRQIEVYAQPRGGKSPGYRQRQDYDLDAILPVVLGTEVIAHLPVRELLPEVKTQS